MRKGISRGTALAILAVTLPLGTVSGARTASHTAAPEPPAVTDKTGGSVNPVEAFKAFLSEPPIVESIFFTERLPPDPKQPWRMDVPLESSKAFRFYEGRWQPGALLLCALPGNKILEKGAPPHLFAAHYGDECWFHWGDSVREKVLQAGVGATNTTCRAVEANSALLAQVLAFGLLHADPGSFRWAGNRFRVANPRDGFAISGELTISAAGQPDSLRVIYTSEDGDVHWVIRYGYNRTVINGALPTTIRSFFLDGSREVERSELTISRLKTSAVRLDRTNFWAKSAIDMTGWHLVLTTNNAAYAVLPDGKLEYIRALGDPPMRPSRRRESPPHVAAVYCGVAAANAAFLILGVRMMRRNQSEQQRKRENV